MTDNKGALEYRINFNKLSMMDFDSSALFLRKTLMDNYEEIAFKAFAIYGYTKEWLLNPANSHRVIIEHKCDDMIRNYKMDDVLLFTIETEFTHDHAAQNLVVRHKVIYHVGDIPEMEE